jgi:hypothetical protein
LSVADFVLACWALEDKLVDALSSAPPCSATAEQAAAAVVFADRHQRRMVSFKTLSAPVGAARIERAVPRRIDQRWDLSIADRHLGNDRAIGIRDDRDRGQQCLRVRMKRRLHQLVDLADLDYLAEIHDGDPIGDGPDHAEIVRDNDIGEVSALSCLSLVSSPRMRACTETSSADVGSSSTRTGGSSASARAMFTRCFWPPLSDAG